VTHKQQTEDPKVAALRETRSLNRRPEAVTDARFDSSDFFDARDLAQVKYEMVRAVREEDTPVTAAARRVRPVPPDLLPGRGPPRWGPAWRWLR
jgi:hypothetical protein